MDNFNFYSPTYFAFGRDREQDAGALVKRFGGKGADPLRRRQRSALRAA